MSGRTVHPLHSSWRLALLLVGGLGVVAVGAAAGDLLGLSGSESWLRTESVAEQTVALVAGAALAAFSSHVLLRARLVIDDEAIHWPRFRPWCTQARLPLAELRRFGDGTVSSGAGRRDRILLLETDNGVERVKSSMFRRAARVPDELAQRLGRGPSPTRAAWPRVVFDDER